VAHQRHVAYCGSGDWDRTIVIVDDLDGSRLRRVPDDEPGLRQRREMAVDGGWRTQAHGVANLTDGRRIPAIGDRVANEIEDLSLARRE
jgi:hypothetical protein